MFPQKKSPALESRGWKSDIDVMRRAISLLLASLLTSGGMYFLYLQVAEGGSAGRSMAASLGAIAIGVAWLYADFTQD